MATGKKAPTKAAPAETPFAELGLPSAERLQAQALAPSQERVRQFLRALSARPPQVLLLEGGDASSRLAMALWWGALTHCQGPAPAVHIQDAPSLLPGLAPAAPELPALDSSQSSEPPCVQCDPCHQFFSGVHNNLHVLSGAVDMIKIDQVREIIPKLSEKPAGNGQRCILLHEAHNCRAETANALLKSLEEPKPGNTFLLLTPQRERLLPTLVSRSLVMSLAWPDPALPPQVLREEPAAREGMDAALQALAKHLATGCGWFVGGGKSSIDRGMAQAFVLECQRRLALALRGEATLSPALFARWEPPALHQADAMLSEAQASLELFVTPALVLDWLAMQLRLRHLPRPTAPKP